MQINDEDYIEVAIHEVAGAPNTSEAFSMIIVEKGNLDNYLPILIGMNEARAIVAELHDNLPFRPLTHTLLPDLLSDLVEGYAIEFVSIDGYNNGIYYASIVIKTPNDNYAKLDARPSDAVAIALHSSVPVYFNCKLWDEQHLSRETNKQSATSNNDNPYDDSDYLRTLTIGKLREILDNDIEQELYEHAALVQAIINEKEDGNKENI